MSSRDTRRRDDRRESRRDRRPVEDPRDPREYRERESREPSEWSEWTWSSEHNSYYRHRTDINGQPEYQFHSQPGVSAQTTYPGPSTNQSQQWNQGPSDARQDWDRQVHQPAPPPRANESYLPPTLPPTQSYPSHGRQMPPPPLPTAVDNSHRPSSESAGQGRETRDPRDLRDLRDPRDPRDPRARPARPPEKKEYFVPGEGIDREVITADICRYLDRDALVRPGTHRNPRSGQDQRGFFITALFPLTQENIADLKADTQRWHEERRSRADVYRNSQVHDTRQYYGPSNIYGTEVPPSTNRYSGSAMETDPRPINYASTAPTVQTTHVPQSQNPQPVQHAQTSHHNQHSSFSQNPLASTGYPPAAPGNQYAPPPNYVTSGRENYYSTDPHPPTPQERPATQTQGFTQPRSAATYFDSQAQPSMVDTSRATTNYVQTTDENPNPFAASIRSQSSPTTAFGQVATATTTTSTTRVGRTETAKRQRTHDPDEMEFSE